jgi:hypothetical protein
VASLSVLVSVGNAIGEPWAYSFAVAVALEVAVLAAIVRLAWTWPRTGILVALWSPAAALVVVGISIVLGPMGTRRPNRFLRLEPVVRAPEDEEPSQRGEKTS